MPLSPTYDGSKLLFKLPLPRRPPIIVSVNAAVDDSICVTKIVHTTRVVLRFVILVPDGFSCRLVIGIGYLRGAKASVGLPIAKGR